MKKLNFILLMNISLIVFQSCNNDDDDGEPQSPTLAIGDFHEGGVIFYIDDSGEHGLACDIDDLGFDKEWGCPSLISFGAKGLEIGTGAHPYASDGTSERG